MTLIKRIITDNISIKFFKLDEGLKKDYQSSGVNRFAELP